MQIEKKKRKESRKQMQEGIRIKCDDERKMGKVESENLERETKVKVMEKSRKYVNAKKGGKKRVREKEVK